MTDEFNKFWSRWLWQAYKESLERTKLFEAIIAEARARKKPED